MPPHDTKSRLRADTLAQYEHRYRRFHALSRHVRALGASAEECLQALRRIHELFVQASDGAQTPPTAFVDAGGERVAISLGDQTLSAARLFADLEEPVGVLRRAVPGFEQAFRVFADPQQAALGLSQRLSVFERLRAPDAIERSPLVETTPQSAQRYLDFLHGVFGSLESFPTVHAAALEEHSEEFRGAWVMRLVSAARFAGQARRQAFGAINWPGGSPPGEVAAFDESFPRQAREARENLTAMRADWADGLAELRRELADFVVPDELGAGWQAASDLLRGATLDHELRELSPDHVRQAAVPALKRDNLTVTHAAARAHAFQDAAAKLAAFEARLRRALTEDLLPVARRLDAVLDAAARWGTRYRELMIDAPTLVGAEVLAVATDGIEQCLEYLAEYLREIAPSHERTTRMVSERTRQQNLARLDELEAGLSDRERALAEATDRFGELHEALAQHLERQAEEYHERLYPLLKDYAALPEPASDAASEETPEQRLRRVRDALTRVRRPFATDLEDVLDEIEKARDATEADLLQARKHAQRVEAAARRSRWISSGIVAMALIGAGICAFLWARQRFQETPPAPRPVAQLFDRLLADAVLEGGAGVDRALAEWRRSDASRAIQAAGDLLARSDVAQLDGDAPTKLAQAGTGVLLAHFGHGEWDRCQTLARSLLSHRDVRASLPPTSLALAQLCARDWPRETLDAPARWSSLADDVWGAAAQESGDAPFRAFATTWERLETITLVGVDAPNTDAPWTLDGALQTLHQAGDGPWPRSGTPATEAERLAMRSVFALAQLSLADRRRDRAPAVTLVERQGEALEALEVLAQLGAKLSGAGASPFVVTALRMRRLQDEESAWRRFTGFGAGSAVDYPGAVEVLAARLPSWGEVRYLHWLAQTLTRVGGSYDAVRLAFGGRASVWAVPGDAVLLPLLETERQAVIAETGMTPWVRRLALALDYAQGALPQVSPSSRAWQESREARLPAAQLFASLEAGENDEWRHDFQVFFNEHRDAKTRFVEHLETLFTSLRALERP